MPNTTIMMASSKKISETESRYEIFTWKDWQINIRKASYRTSHRYLLHMIKIMKRKEAKTNPLLEDGTKLIPLKLIYKNETKSKPISHFTGNKKK